MTTLRDALERTGLAPKPNSEPPQDVVPGCPHKHEWQPAHPCPFDSDVRNDPTKLCRCCPVCEDNCLREI